MKQIMALLCAAVLFPTISFAHHNNHIEHSYDIDIRGSTATVYEFVPRSNKEYVCILIRQNHKEPALDCIPSRENKVVIPE